MGDAVQRYQELLETAPCNNCGADNYTMIYPSRYEMARPDEIRNTFRSSGDEILLDQLVRCNHCGLQYLNPRLRSDIVIESYSEGTDEVFVSQVPSRERTFAKSLKWIERLRPSKGRILDVGTAGGSFLAVARRSGWDATGCEPNRWMTGWSKSHYGLNIFPGTIFDMHLADNSFDVVSLWDVLEHTSDPKALLNECYRVLKQGGLLVINYPDISSLVARLMGRRWIFLLSVHLYYFTEKTITHMLEKSGFKVLRRRLHWQTLELTYILFRMKPYIGRLADLGNRVARILRIERLQIPYWMGQVLIAAEK